MDGNDGKVNADPMANAGGQQESNFLVVGIGASAGGIQAMKSFFANVPADSGAAYIVILHLSPDHESRLAEVLQTSARIPVTQVRETVKIEPNHVYVVPPNQSLEVHDGTLTVSNVTKIEERRAPVDLFLRTLADSWQSQAAAVILSGTGPNGSMGIKRIKEMGGVVFVQDPHEAEYSDMPRNSIATGLVDQILPVAEIPQKLSDYKKSQVKFQIPVETRDRSEEDEQALREIFTHLRVKTGHDFSNYKRPTILRRLERRINVRELEGLPEYALYLRENADEINLLLKDFLISVTNFFRDPQAFLAIENQIIPTILDGRSSEKPVRIWIPGCATGEEAYSLAMLFAEHTLGALDAPDVQIFATDIDDDALAIARDGLYSESDIADVSPERLRRFFVKEPNGFRVRREIREMVLFASHNVLKDPPFSHLDLVSCRNLLIYLNRMAQERILETFHFALEAAGYLLLGSSESVENVSNLFVSVNKDQRIYQSRPVVTRMPFPVPDISPFPRYQLPTSAPQQNPSDKRIQDRMTFAALHLRLLEQYAPPSVVVDENFDIVHMSERAGRYFQFAGGEPTNNLLKLIRPELRLELRTALYQATQRQTNVEARTMPINIEGREEVLNIIVRPVFGEVEPTRGFILILFERGENEETAAETQAVGAIEPIARQLEDELIRTKSQLRLTVEQYEVQNEELKASNEELQAMNEELRSAAEELETSKEELQSLNEELTTVNQELKIKIEELSHAHNDLKNLMNSTEIATIFLDRALRIKRFTPAAKQVFNLIPSDTGRPLQDITSNLNYEDLPRDAEFVQQRLQSFEREVETKKGEWFLMRISPYRTGEDQIIGVVLSFIDITGRKQAEEVIRRSEEQFRRAIEKAPIPVIMHAEDGAVLQISQTWTELTGYTLADVPTFDLWINKAYGEGAEDVRLHMHELFKGDKAVLNVEFPVRTRSGEMRHWSFSASSPGTLQDGRRFIVGMAVDITERTVAEENLRVSEERFKAMFDGANIGIVQITPEGVLRSPNKGFCNFLGYTAEEISRLKVSDICHPDDLPQEIELSRRLMAGEITDFNLVKRYLHKNGSVLWGNMTATVMRRTAHDPNYLVAVVEDITERKEATEGLDKSEERFRMVVESVTDYAIITQSEEGIIQTWNPGAERIFGFAAKEAIGQHVDLIFTPQDREKRESEKEMQTAQERGRAMDERWHLRKDGSRFFASGVLTPLRYDRLSGYVKICRDLTRQKEAEEALRRAQEELEERVAERTEALALANDKLRREISERIQAEVGRGRLLRKIVRGQEDERRRIARDIHDQLGQATTALRLNLESLRKQCEKYDDLCEEIDKTQKIAQRLDAEVDFLIWEIRPAVLDELGLKAALANFINEWSQHHNIAADFHSTGLEDERLPAETETNIYRIAQEALNNVLKHAEATGVGVMLERRDEQAILIIEDNGKGFDPAERENVAENDRGMGLIGMRERAALVGGILEIESAPGKGTTVFARMPIVEPEEDE